MFHKAPDWAPGRPDFAIDLGTASTVVVARSGSVAFDQPTLCCFDDACPAAPPFAVGSAAKRILGREVGRLRSVRPLAKGVLVDVAAARELLRFAVAPLGRPGRLRRARVAIGIPSDATQAERRALEKAAHDAGLARPLLVAEPILAALGSELDVREPRGRMVVDCGAGVTDVVVISMGELCVARSARGGGDAVDAALAQHLRLRRHFHVGPLSAEAFKKTLSDALGSGSATHVEVRGLDVRDGLPRVLNVEVDEVRPILERFATEVAAAVRSALAVTDPDLAAAILEDGITLTGGASMTALLAESIFASTGIRARNSAGAEKAVARGLAPLMR